MKLPIKQALNRSMAIQAGVRVLDTREPRLVFPSPGGTFATDEQFPENYLVMELRPIRFKIPYNERADWLTDDQPFAADVWDNTAAAIDLMAWSKLISSPDIGKVEMEHLFDGRGTFNMIGCVEEANAKLEAFVVRRNDKNPPPVSFHGWPVIHSDNAPENMMLGGMWSDALLMLGPEITVEKVESGWEGEIQADFALRHSAAFVIGKEPEKEPACLGTNV